MTSQTITTELSAPHSLSLAQRLYRGDPLLVWLRDRRQISYPLWVVGLALLGFGLLTLLPPLLGAQRASMALALAVMQGLVIMPLGFSLYLLIPDFVAGLFDSLGRGGIIAGPRRTEDVDYSTFLDRLVRSANSRGWYILALLSVVLYWYYRLVVLSTSDANMDIPEPNRIWARLAYLLLYTPLIYGGVLSLARLLTGLLYSQRLFRQFKLQVNPLNPDGAGGLSVVGRMLLVSVLVAVVLGAASVGAMFFDIAAGRDPFTRSETIALGAIYLVITPLLFLVWLWAPHLALLEARQEALQPLGDEYQRAAAQAVPASGETAEHIKAKTERLVEIKRQYELVRDTYPTWPLPDQTVKRLAATASLPALSPLLSGAAVRLGEYLLQLFQGK